MMTIEKVYSLLRNIALIVLFSVACTQYAACQHAFRFSADFSYARDIPVQSNGFAPGLSIGYRYKYRHFIVDLGVGAQYRYRVNKLETLTNIVENELDEVGTPYTGHHIWDKRKDQKQNIGVNIPLRFGGEWNKLYFLVGAKFNVDIWGNSKEKGLYTLLADYERYMDPMTDMPLHGFVLDEPYTNDAVSSRLGWDLRVCGEIGYKLSKIYSVGAFVEAGVVSSTDVKPLLIGARLNILLRGKEKRRCMCLDD